ncbi:MAG: adenosylcobinamide-GDP ribazoletransferase [Arachnia sp.]
MLLDAWRLGVGTLTAVPVRPPVIVDRDRAGAAMMLAPLAVLPLGAAMALVAFVGQAASLPATVTALLALAAAILGTRGFHLDGLSDTADGLAASYDSARSLSVMKSGTAGPAGVVASILVIGLQAAALSSLLATQPSWSTCVLAGLALCTSRVGLAIGCMTGFRPARPDGLGATFTQTVPGWVAALLVALAAAIVATGGWWAGLGWWRGALAVVAAALVAVVVFVIAVRRFGGVTGDVLGASVELGFATMLMVLSSGASLG